MNRKTVVISALLLMTASLAAAQSQQTPVAEEVVRIAGTDYYLHTVSAGETVYSLSKLYGITEERFYADNPSVRDNGLKTGETVRLVCAVLPESDMPRRKMRRTFETHAVQAGETTYSIAKRYSLSLNVLIHDNPGIDPAHLRVGQELLIRKSEMDKTSPQQIFVQMGDLAAILSDVSDEYVYYLVEMGDTLYSLSKKYGVAIADIEAANVLTDGLKAGALLRIPVSSSITETVIGEEHHDVGVWDSESWEPEPVVPTHIPVYGTLDVAMLLPLSEQAVVRSEFMEFYEGALIGIAELRDSGQVVNLNLFDTQRSAVALTDIVSSSAFRSADVIIGPVYEESLPAVMRYSSVTGVPVVSPLAEMGDNYGPTFYQMPPSHEFKYDKLAGLFHGPDKNIIFITSDITDDGFEQEMKHVVGGNVYQRVTYRKGTPSEQIDDLIAGSGRENVFVVLAGDETGVDMILAALSSVQNSRIARSRRTGKITVVGNSKWLRYRNLDRNLFFKLNVSFITSYHADRGSEAILDFDARYIEAFGRVPSLYSYRGYDAVMIFGGGALQSGEVSLDTVTPLQTPYRFVSEVGGNRVNAEWALVRYGDDYTITVE